MEQTRSVSKLIAAIKTEYRDMWTKNDPAHREEHFDDVFNAGIKINKVCQLNLNPYMIVIFAYFHDLFTWNRKDHHMLGAEYVRTTTNRLVLETLNETEINIVATAIEEHRASYKGTYSNVFSAAMASADRGLPGNIQELYQRSIDYTRANYPKSNERKIISTAVNHISDKFGHGGYAVYPDLYEKTFQEELKIQRNLIAYAKRVFYEDYYDDSERSYLFLPFLSTLNFSIPAKVTE